MLDEIRKKRAEEKLLQAQKEMDEIKAEEKRIQDEKDAKARKRKSLETSWHTKNVIYGIGQPVHRRLAMWLQLSLNDPRAFKPDVIEAYGLNDLFQFLQEHAKKPVSPPHFDENNDLITE